ncbi:MAG TPA: hypothetical protein VJI69_02265 [Bacteroidia bacterium]|nr:hypothetical protein [Bacteroidia bacterium]
MNKAYSAILLLLLTNCLFSQTGTIKITKPTAIKKDTVIPQKSNRAIITSVSSNYTFKGINKLGYEAEVLVGFYNNHCFVGLKYCNENQYYQLSPYNSETLSIETGYLKSENKSDYLKMPIGFSGFMTTGNKGKFCLSMAIVPEYLLKTKNQYDRLSYTDFNQFNLAGYVSLGIPIRKLNLSVNLSYSRDFFNNLKDKNIYNEQGAKVGTQKSKTNLVALSISYRIQTYGNKNKAF